PYPGKRPESTVSTGWDRSYLGRGGAGHTRPGWDWSTRPGWDWSTRPGWDWSTRPGWDWSYRARWGRSYPTRVGLAAQAGFGLTGPDHDTSAAGKPAVRLRRELRRGGRILPAPAGDAAVRRRGRGR